MKKENLVIYHANCADGFGAAFAAWRALGNTADYVPFTYGTPPPDVTGRNVYVLDFSFEPTHLQQIDDQAKSLVLLDHHASAAEMLKGFQCRCGKVHFDMTKCGARLAWEHFHPAAPAPRIIDFIEDRDLWKWKKEFSRGYLCALDTEEKTFEAWDRVAKMDSLDSIRYSASGDAMLKKTESLCTSILHDSKIVKLLGQTGLMVNGPQEFRDELGNKLAAQSGTFGLVWSQERIGRVKVSLRGAPGYDALPLATKMGGGGHPQACSFYLSLEKVPALMMGNLSN